MTCGHPDSGGHCWQLLLLVRSITATAVIEMHCYTRNNSRLDGWQVPSSSPTASAGRQVPANPSGVFTTSAAGVLKKPCSWQAAVAARVMFFSEHLSDLLERTEHVPATKSAVGIGWIARGHSLKTKPTDMTQVHIFSPRSVTYAL